MKRMSEMLAAFAFFVFPCILFSGCAETITAPVSVMVAEGEGYRVLGENPQRVLPGETVHFELELEDGWSLVGEDGRICEDAVITAEHVLYPVTIVPDVREHVRYYQLQFCDPMLLGTISSTAAPGAVIEGSRVQVSATPKEGYRFVGWTGEDKKDVRSTDSTYTFTIDSDTVLYARYESESDVESVPTALLVYHANGGVCTLSDAENGIYYEDIAVDQYKLPNCMADLGQFVREGYHLVEYNTQPDGSGDGYSLGSRIILDTGLTHEDSAVLYCIWKKETEASAFQWKEENGEITITGYTGTHEELIIPAYIEGKPVTKINKNAFCDCSFETFSIPTTMRTIQARAFADCTKMVTMYFPDTVENVNDNSFWHCSESWKHFYLNAAMAPRYTPEMVTKVEAIITTQDQNRLVVLSGSSSLHGLDSEQLSEALDDRYYVVNHGTNAGVTATVYMEMYQYFLHEGDVFVQAPEYSNEQLGSTAVSWKTYRELESFYNVFRYLDASRYTFFNGFQEHQKTRLPMAATSYNTRNRTLTEHGDLISGEARKKLNSPNYTSNFNISYAIGVPNKAFADALNTCHDALRAAGCTVYVSFAPHNYNGLTAQARTLSTREAYTRYMRSMLDSPVISNLSDFTLAGEYIYDSDWHPNDEGRRIRTEQLAKDIRAQLVKDGIFDS